MCSRLIWPVMSGTPPHDPHRPPDYGGQPPYISYAQTPQPPPPYLPPAPKTQPGLSVVSEAVVLFRANPGVWLLNGVMGTLLCLVAVLPVYLHPPVFPFDPNNTGALMDGILSISASPGNFFATNQVPLEWMVISTVILTWVGYIHMAASYPLVAKQLSGEPITASDAISFNGNGAKVLLVSFLMGLEVTVAYFCCYFPGPIVEGLTMVTAHRTVDKGEGVIASFRNGKRAVQSRIFLATFVVHLLGGILFVALLLLSWPLLGLVALMVTIPIYNISRALLYRRTIQAEQIRLASMAPPRIR